MDVKSVLLPNKTLPIKAATITEAQPKAAGRILFVDNLRIFLTILVILHHVMNIYAASGGWIYQEGRQDLVTALLGKWFTVVNQSYFMGLFLLIAAYFVPGSYDRKGPARFIKDRLVRLGIPLALYSWIIRPLLIYAAQSFFGGTNVPIMGWYFQQYFRDYGFLGGGPLWFISALLIFSILYAIVRWLISIRLKPQSPVSLTDSTPFPGNRSIALLGLLIATAAFIVRLWYPADKVFTPLSFQFADFPQYVMLFLVGVMAYRHNWLARLPAKTGKLWMMVAGVLILSWPPIVILLGALENSTAFLGGFTWQSALSATWQSFLGISMCVSAVHIFKTHLNKQGHLSGFLSRNAYTAYLIHEAVITFVALSVAGVMLYPLLKFGLTAVVTVPLIFCLSYLIRKLPLTEHVL